MAFDDAIAVLRPHLERRLATKQELHIFLRDDDVDVDEGPLRHLLELSLSRCVPLNLEIIPAGLTDAAAKLLDYYTRCCPTLVELHQHGWQHVNHEPTGRKCEFGVSRQVGQQLQDIARGKRLLEARFEERFYPAFTPPWNRCTEETFQVLDALDFHVLSKDTGRQTVSGYHFREISVTLDFYRWKGGATLKAPEDIIAQLVAQMPTHNPIGLMLHHKVMDAYAFAFLDRLLEELGRYPMVRFHTLHTLHTLQSRHVGVDDTHATQESDTL
jgi:hypothetical protein